MLEISTMRRIRRRAPALPAGIETDAGSGDWSDLGARVAAVVEEYARLEAFCRNDNDGN